MIVEGLVVSCAASRGRVAGDVCVLGRGASRRRRIQAWREVNELPGRELMRGGL
jgi:hypothetical protein